MALQCCCLILRCVVSRKPFRLNCKDIYLSAENKHDTPSTHCYLCNSTSSGVLAINHNIPSVEAGQQQTDQTWVCWQVGSSFGHLWGQSGSFLFIHIQWLLLSAVLGSFLMAFLRTLSTDPYVRKKPGGRTDDKAFATHLDWPHLSLPALYCRFSHQVWEPKLFSFKGLCHPSKRQLAL